MKIWFIHNILNDEILGNGLIKNELPNVGNLNYVISEFLDLYHIIDESNRRIPYLESRYENIKIN